MPPSGATGVYDAVIERLFQASAASSYRFGRADINAAARAIAGKEIANVGDLIYTYRYRRPFPSAVSRVVPQTPHHQPAEWALRLRGRVAGNTTYEFGPVRQHYFEPASRWPGDVPVLEGKVAGIVADATAVLHRGNKLSDEQALLARARSANLIAEALGLTNAVAFQSNKRTTHEDFGQIEIDELYVGTDAETGQRFVIPVQVKTGNDKLSVVQVEQDWKWCREQFGRAGWEVVPLGLRPLTSPASGGPLDVAIFEFSLEVPVPRSVGPHGDFAAVEHRFRIR